MNETWRESEDEHLAKTKSQWERPVMTFLGNVRDLVHGMGKTGLNDDMDPTGTRKSGVG